MVFASNASPERSPERDAAIDALLPHVETQGWTVQALRTALAESGGDPQDAELLFPRGAADMIDAFCDLADRRMEAAAEVGGLRVSQRVRAILALRLEQNYPYREAIRRALAILALPRHAGLSARITARTVDAVWHTAGDRSADFSWYSKRAILAAVYGATLLFWLRDGSEESADTMAFLDRRLADVARIGRLGAKLRPAARRQAA